MVYSDPQEKYEMSITNRTMSGQSGGSTQQIIKSGGKKTKTITKKVITETEITEVEEEGEDQIIVCLNILRQFS